MLARSVVVAAAAASICHDAASPREMRFVRFVKLLNHLREPKTVNSSIILLQENCHAFVSKQLSQRVTTRFFSIQFRTQTKILMVSEKNG